MTGMFRWLKYRIAKALAKQHRSGGPYPLTPYGNWRWYREHLAPTIVAAYERQRGRR